MALSKRIKITVPQVLANSNGKFSDSWLVLKEGLDKIYTDCIEDVSYQDLYKLVYSLVINENGELLYKHLKEYLVERLTSSMVETLMPEIPPNQEEGLEQTWTFLIKFDQFFEREAKRFKLVADVMIYFDKVYCNAQRIPEVFDLGLNAFRDTVVFPLKDNLNESIIKVINNARDEGQIKRSFVLEAVQISVLKSLFHMMETISAEKNDDPNHFYTGIFEPLLIERSSEYYRNNVDWTDYTALQTFEKMGAMIKFEKAFMEGLINPDSSHKLIDILTNTFVSGKLKDILGELINEVMTSKDRTLLQRLSSISEDEEYRRDLVEGVKDYISRDFYSIKLDEVTRKKAIAAAKWVSDLVEKFEQYSSFLKGAAFAESIPSNTANEGHSSSIASVLGDATSNFFADDPMQSAQFVSLYFDVQLKASKPSKAELGNVVMLLKFLSEKDEFVNVYKQQLSRRLLHQRTTIDMERYMINRIKDEMGSFFTLKLESMLRDVTTSSELLKSLPEHEKQFEFIPQVLTMTAWPFQNLNDFDADLILPRELQKVKENLEVAYNKKYNQRVLNWAHKLGLIEISYRFEKSSHDLAMSFYAGLIFLAFEEQDELTTEKLQQLTNLPEQELVKQLVTLAVAPRYRILLKEPNTKTIRMTDTFRVNERYTAATKSVRIQTVISPNTISNAVQDKNSQLDKERTIVTNAAIVRILKPSRQMIFDDLFDQAKKLVEQRFTLTKQTFKRSIDHLIDKEYVQRDPNDHEVYHYIT
ncbi:cullin CUL3 KNAG_0D03390 [Huiozyma naganishii CBS 8797]|uniref:Cullin family profile domain-containing protein n=1 Tax=Huiozyma naganishii (strain ATCC MYA-139 / BCRC 22969 / CBS 8797 / KCTC 17520 / NBRC 10181 / NCYC 3082 / Yp74L-3) TaxID=1071383 RepID=J7S737_HUIN7|nr:hypothetical protein KNAG_0D03390 [Kazachstania naganishii CBS 8797]CCK70086.1 hypothetical protein KNAG_0D03390 [Kazachstania naganishii CBS 8797]